MRRNLILGLIFLLFGLVIIRSEAAQAGTGIPSPAEQTTIQINGIANWATPPTGSDFSGVHRIPFQAQNPSLDIWQQTQFSIQPYLVSTYSIGNFQVSTSGSVPGASHFVNDFSEVMVAIDPTDACHLLGASKFFYNPTAYLFYTGVFESYDCGLSWNELQPDGVEGYSLTSDPVTTFDSMGNGFFTLLTRGPTGLDMLTKPAGGNWQPTVIVDRTTSTDKQWIIGDQDPQGISPYADNLYMSWTSFGGPVTGIVLSRSTDQNTTWSTPIHLAGGDVQGSIPGVAPDGTVYVVFGRSIFYGPTSGTMEIVSSVDGGQTFNAPTIAANITAIPFNLPDPFGSIHPFRTPASLPAFAVSPSNGSLFVAWADYRHGDADIYLTKSSDGGLNWNAPLRLNDDPIGNGIDQFQPQVSISANGRVAVMWFDRRLPCPDLPWIPPNHVGAQNGCIDTFMTRSYDDGISWTPNIRASAQTWDWTLNLPWDGSGYGFIGDYQGIASSNDYDYPFWNATANLGANPDNYQEIFIARIPVPYINLSASTKTVSSEIVTPGEMLTYTISIINLGLDIDPVVVLTDPVPLFTTYVPGSLDYPSGSGGFDPATGVITWTGEILAGEAINITFQVTVERGVVGGSFIENLAQIQSSTGEIIAVSASSRLNWLVTIPISWK